MKKLHLSFLGAWVLALGAALPAQADTISFNVTTTWYEPMTQPDNSVFVGSFSYDTSTHAVTNLSGSLSEAMTGMMGNMTWLSLNNQLPNGDASHTYEWYDSTTGGAFATVFKNTDSLTFATSATISGTTYTGDGWSPEGGIAVKSKYAGYPNGYANGPQNAYALIFVPDNLSSANTASNPLTLAWDESSGTGNSGLEYTAYADYTPGGQMGTIGMTATSKYAYGQVGTMDGYPLSEVIYTTAVPEPSTIVLGAVALAVAVGFRRLRQSKRSA
jgi:hypothetical protein